MIRFIDSFMEYLFWANDTRKTNDTQTDGLELVMQPENVAGTAHQIFFDKLLLAQCTFLYLMKTSENLIFN